MKTTIPKAAILILISIIAVALAASRSLRLGGSGINPNLTLILFLFPAVLNSNLKEKLILLLAAFAVNALLWSGWLKELTILGGFSLAAILWRKFLFDRPYLDYAVIIAFTTAGFYAAANLPYLVSHPNRIIAETIYNIILGIILLNLWAKSLKST
jgi:hypothetical protein